MKISRDGLEFISKYEGFSDVVYKCPAGKWTIGYGYMLSSKEYELAKHMKITEDGAFDLLKETTQIVEDLINDKVNVFLSQKQFDVLCSLVYNWGVTNFLKSKGFKALSVGDYKEASKQFFSKEEGVVNINRKFSQGLYNRRKAEEKLWWELLQNS